MAKDYVALFEDVSSAQTIARSAARVKVLLEQYGMWIDKYRGGIPREWAAAIMMWESDGNFAAPGDPSLGEVGFYQVAEYVPATMGMPAVARTVPEANVMIGLTEYQMDTVKWKLAFPDYVELGTPDAYKLARLSFAVGWGGATGLATQAIASSGIVVAGTLYQAIVDYVTQNGGIALGSQSPSQVWFRVVSIEPQWRTAEAASTFGLSVGPPTLPPAPPGFGYELPIQYQMYFQKPTSLLTFAAAILGVVVLWRYFG